LPKEQHAKPLRHQIGHSRVERIADAPGDSTRSGGVLLDDLPRMSPSGRFCWKSPK